MNDSVESDLAGPGFWSEAVRFRSYDVDSRQRATPEAVCRYFLDAAWNHAEALGVGFSHLANQNQFWVLSRFLLKAERLPHWGETVTLRTWPRAVKGVLAMRDFELVDAGGTRVLGGVSAWLVLDATSRRPQRLEKLRWSLSQFPDRRATDREPGKLPECVDSAECFSIKVRHGDLDVNDHVNSACYIRWLSDSYPHEFHEHHSIRSLEINYVGETKAEELVSARMRTDGPGTFCHRLEKGEKEEICRARLLWHEEKP